PGLEAFLLPVLLVIEPSDSHHYSPAPRELLAASLRSSRALWSSFSLTTATTPALRPLPGARWELTCELKQGGTLPGRSLGSETLHWQFELVFTGGRWQCLRIRF